jgi:SAM-dependent methyltransferase
MNNKKKISSIVQKIRTGGLSEILRLIKRKFARKKIRNFKLYQDLFYNKEGIEIGGPSLFFEKDLPIYHEIKALDSVNFSSSTVWEGQLIEGENFKYEDNKTGYQFICDAVNLDKIEPNKYDFVLSCNNLEHIANPFKALSAWLRIIKQNGLILLVVPDKDTNFDHKRKITKFEHLLEDFKNNTTEDDLTHLAEILALHDRSMDPASGDSDFFKKRSLNNFENRCLHHHVFDLKLLKQIYKYLNIEILRTDHANTNFVILGLKK